MRQLLIGVTLAAGMTASTPALAATASVTAGDLVTRCTADRNICEASVKWIEDNTGACIRTGQTHDMVVTQVIGWLKKHPAQRGTDDNDVTGYAVSDLWPCR